ncbi:hypothetical protein ACIGG9_15940 [Pseudonocardia alni]|uniref:hypothetical protein n=1 Tax=Pseudonocardia alni TaxID=33907 RepID=UPI0033D75151
MPEGQYYDEIAAEQAREFRASAEVVRSMQELPRPLRAAVSHVLSAACTELANGRVLPIEIRRAVRHVQKAVREVEQGLGR